MGHPKTPGVDTPKVKNLVKHIDFTKGDYSYGLSNFPINSYFLHPMGGAIKRYHNYVNQISTFKGGDKPLFDQNMSKFLDELAVDKKWFRSFEDYLAKLKDSKGIRFTRGYYQPDMIMVALEKFSRPNHKTFAWNRNFKEAVCWLQSKLRVSDLGLKALRYKNDDDIKLALPKDDTHPGLTRITHGYRTKKDLIEGSFEKFKAFINYGIKHDKLPRTPIMIGTRTQASGEVVDGKLSNTCKLKCRLVSMICFFLILLERMFSFPFQDAFVKSNMFAGGKNDPELLSIIQNRRGNYKYWVTVDYSSYDQTISDWLIRTAFNDIIKPCFKFRDEVESKLFELMVDRFINKEFLINENKTVISHKGVPSGSMWTQIIDSLVNLIMVKTYCLSKGIEFEMICMGDDNIIFSNVEINLEDMKSYFNRNFGIELNPEKCARGDSTVPCQFLSRNWYGDKVYRCIYELVSRMLYPERFRDYKKGLVKTELLLYSYFYMSRSTVSKHFMMSKVFNEFPNLNKDFKNVSSRYLPGSYAYLRDYVNADHAGRKRDRIMQLSYS